MKAWVFESDAFVRCDGLPVTDRAFRYGMSVFETIVIHRGTPLFLQEHLDRLRVATGQAGFVYPNHLESAVRAALAGEESAMVRLYVTAGDGSALADFGAGRLYLLCEELPPSTGEARVTISRAIYVAAPGGWKTGNYWQNVRAFAEAREEGWDDALLIDPSGAIVSATMANVFVVLDGVLCTPPGATGARDGVVQAWVRQAAAVEERLMTVTDVEIASECFLTNSRVGIRAVSELDGRPLASREYSSELAARYASEVLGR